MIRAVAESVAFFFLPFLLFALYLVARRRNPSAVDAWTGGVVGALSLVGLALAALGILAFGLFEERPRGAWTPAHIEDGKLVPGRFQ